MLLRKFLSLQLVDFALNTLKLTIPYQILTLCKFWGQFKSQIPAVQRNKKEVNLSYDSLSTKL